MLFQSFNQLKIAQPVLVGVIEVAGSDLSLGPYQYTEVLLIPGFI